MGSLYPIAAGTSWELAYMVLATTLGLLMLVVFQKGRQRSPQPVFVPRSVLVLERTNQ